MAAFSAFAALTCTLSLTSVATLYPFMAATMSSVVPARGGRISRILGTCESKWRLKCDVWLDLRGFVIVLTEKKADSVKLRPICAFYTLPIVVLSNSCTRMNRYPPLLYRYCYIATIKKVTLCCNPEVFQLHTQERWHPVDGLWLQVCRRQDETIIIPAWSPLTRRANAAGRR